MLAHLLLAPLNNTSQTIHLLLFNFLKKQINSLPYTLSDFIGINPARRQPGRQSLICRFTQRLQCLLQAD